GIRSQELPAFPPDCPSPGTDRPVPLSSPHPASVPSRHRRCVRLGGLPLGTGDCGRVTSCRIRPRRRGAAGRLPARRQVSFLWWTWALLERPPPLYAVVGAAYWARTRCPMPSLSSSL